MLQLQSRSSNLPQRLHCPSRRIGPSKSASLTPRGATSPPRDEMNFFFFITKNTRMPPAYRLHAMLQGSQKALNLCSFDRLPRDMERYAAFPRAYLDLKKKFIVARYLFRVGLGETARSAFERPTLHIHIHTLSHIHVTSCGRIANYKNGKNDDKLSHAITSSHFTRLCAERLFEACHMRSVADCTLGSHAWRRASRSRLAGSSRAAVVEPEGGVVCWCQAKKGQTLAEVGGLGGSPGGDSLNHLIHPQIL
ncbi:hypothetical protein EJ05DRAFT_145453 [Pseudovirgaria hyperparasitica]|uniref:Uncharacterized protein n=1 Tax=Pseudovirgaria hyperparasitica TaxID=470096 RepID=A0A6A6VV68_9PEZI|nr:uncharacterized protein EJ05DRAFT_145453 [Pseudovirgaria hyperparasitica]KAF2754578.1 hypothetical protein EJ05DRAFT_145453 [Pseudovirgaria hyperparasitica]